MFSVTPFFIPRQTKISSRVGGHSNVPKSRATHFEINFYYSFTNFGSSDRPSFDRQKESLENRVFETQFSDINYEGAKCVTYINKHRACIGELAQFLPYQNTISKREAYQLQKWGGQCPRAPPPPPLPHPPPPASLRRPCSYTNTSLHVPAA